MSDKNNSISNGNEAITIQPTLPIIHDENISNVQPLDISASIIEQSDRSISTRSRTRKVILSAKSSCECSVASCARKDDKHMIRCMHCMLWAHRKCVGESNDYMGVWSCHECREQKNIVFRMISDNVSQIVNLNTTMADVGADIAQLKQTVATLGAHICDLKMANGDLCKKIDSLQAENFALKAELDVNTIPNVVPKAKPSLLIGTEMIKDLEPLDPNKLTVNAFQMPNSKILTNILLRFLNRSSKSLKLFIL